MPPSKPVWLISENELNFVAASECVGYIVPLDFRITHVGNFPINNLIDDVWSEITRVHFRNNNGVHIFYSHESAKSWFDKLKDL